MEYKKNERCNGTYNQHYTRSQCVQSLRLGAVSTLDCVRSIFGHSHHLHAERRRNVERRAMRGWVAGKLKIKPYHIRFGFVRQQTLSHPQCTLFLSCFFLDCIPIWTVLVAFIFSIVAIHFIVWADFMNTFILTLSNLMVNAVDKINLVHSFHINQKILCYSLLLFVEVSIFRKSFCNAKKKRKEKEYNQKQSNCFSTYFL